ncbi:hypothetical protein PoB_005166000 [Plakobranchus ocellatus]|uniref:Uncharacterized protein n=1 Tax=Plakobranchus ocellatus TaxID=259542 RepID=A0AAV4C194_9GAST|nr:hypothetical protein PoB_005166000 [Plakobranchus ocellatus]
MALEVRGERPCIRPRVHPKQNGERPDLSGKYWQPTRMYDREFSKQEGRLTSDKDGRNCSVEGSFKKSRRNKDKKENYWKTTF